MIVNCLCTIRCLANCGSLRIIIMCQCGDNDCSYRLLANHGSLRIMCWCDGNDTCAYILCVNTLKINWVEVRIVLMW